VLVQNARVDDGVVARGGRVQLPAEAVEDLGDLLRRVLLRSLEEQVLEEVGDARVPVPIQRPIATERTVSSGSLMTRAPLGSVVSR
jgi:hypothetical protein